MRRRLLQSILLFGTALLAMPSLFLVGAAGLSDFDTAVLAAVAVAVPAFVMMVAVTQLDHRLPGPRANLFKYEQVTDREARARFKKAASEAAVLGLRWSVWREELKGEMGGFAVKVSADERAHASYELAGIPAGLLLAPRSHRRRKGEVITGDDEFDALVRVEGREVLCIAVLGHEARRRYRKAIEVHPDLDVEEGRVACRRPSPAGTSELETILRTLHGLCHALSPLKIPERLQENARLDPIPAVRRRNMSLLALWYPQDAMTRVTARSVVGDSDLGVRLTAALCLGEEGLPVIEAIAFDEAGEPKFRVEAAAGLPPAKALPLLERFLVDAWQDPPLQVAIATSLAILDVPEAEPTLISIVRHGLSDEARLAAVRALGKVGTAASVEVLQPLRAGGEFEGGLGHAAGEAINRIHSRLAGASPGQISIVEPGPGEGSLSVSGEGALSEIDPKVEAGLEAEPVPEAGPRSIVVRQKA